MRIAEFESVSPRISETPFPCRLEQVGSPFGTALVLFLLVPLAFLLFIPFAALVTHIAANPEARDAIAAQPAAAVQIALGITLFSALIGWPLRALLDRLGRKRIVEIDDMQVRVSDMGLFRTKVWSAEISEFLGLAHHVRTTHSGIRHELVLVHHQRQSHVLVALSDRMSEEDVRIVAARLRMAVVPAAFLYRLPKVVSEDRPSPAAVPALIQNAA